MEGYSELMAVPMKEAIPSGCQPRSPQIRYAEMRPNIQKLSVFKRRSAKFAQMQPERQEIFKNRASGRCAKPSKLSKFKLF